MTERVYCIAEFEPKPGCEQELLQRLIGLEPQALREDGCIRYRVTRMIDSDPKLANPRRTFVFHEEWANQEAFAKHAEQIYIKDFFASYVENPETSLTADFSLRLYSDNL